VPLTITTTTDQAYDLDVTALVSAAVAAGDPALTLVVRQTERNGKLAYVQPASVSLVLAPRT
jgi:hypothetical protein